MDRQVVLEAVLVDRVGVPPHTSSALYWRPGRTFKADAIFAPGACALVRVPAELIDEPHHCTLLFDPLIYERGRRFVRVRLPIPPRTPGGAASLSSILAEREAQ